MALAFRSRGRLNAEPTLGYLADRLYLQAAAIYSLRNVVSAYRGPVMQVHRFADGTTRDLNEAQIYDGTLADFAQGGTVGASKLYNQVGGIDLTAPAANRFPKVVVNGQLTISGGRLALRFDGVENYLAAKIDVPQPFSANIRAIAPTNQLAYIFEARDLATPNGQEGRAVALLSAYGGREAFYAGKELFGGAAPSGGTGVGYFISADGQDRGRFSDNQGKDYTGPIGPWGMGTIIVGASQLFGTFVDVGFQEIVVFPSVIDTGHEATIRSAAAEYFG